MNIINAYKTSRGIFFDVNEASKKQNRSKEYGSRPSDTVELAVTANQPMFIRK